MERKCPTPKRNGDRCSGSVPPGKYHCYFHDPENAGKRQRAASRGGKGKASRTVRDLHRLLEDLTSQVISGQTEPYPASVAGQLISVRLRLLEFQRREKEQDELLARLEAVEDLAERREEARRSGRRQPWGG